MKSSLILAALALVAFQVTAADQEIYRCEYSKQGAWEGTVKYCQMPVPPEICMAFKEGSGFYGGLKGVVTANSFLGPCSTEGTIGGCEMRKRSKARFTYYRYYADQEKLATQCGSKTECITEYLARERPKRGKRV